MSFGSGLWFREISHAIFERLRKKGEQSGIPICSQSGKAVKDGSTIQRL
jgi:hypothetical protein